MGFGVNVFKGTFAGNTLTMARREAQDHGRIVWEFPDGQSYRFRMDFSPDGNQWRPFMEGDYARAS